MEIDNVHRERRIARAPGFLPPVFHAQLARPGPQARLHAIDRAVVGRAADPPARKAGVVALLAAGEDTKAHLVIGQPCQPANGKAVIGGAVLRGGIELRGKAARLAEPHFLQRNVDAAAQPRPVAHRGNPARQFDPVDQHHRRIVHRRVHRVRPAAGEVLAVDPQQDALTKHPAQLDLAGEHPVIDQRGARQAGNERSGIGGGGGLAVRRNGFSDGRGGQTRGGDDDGAGIGIGFVGECGRSSGQREQARRSAQQGMEWHETSPDNRMNVRPRGWRAEAGFRRLQAVRSAAGAARPAPARWIHRRMGARVRP